MAGEAPQVRLGRHERGGLAPAILAIVDRGLRERPALARGLQGEIELALAESATPVRLLFANGSVLIEDGRCEAPDVRVQGSLSDLVSLMAAPALGGVPSPVRSRGLSALAIVAQRRIKVQGRVGLARRLLAMIRI